MEKFFAAIESALDQLYAFIAKIFGLVSGFENLGADEEKDA